MNPGLVSNPAPIAGESLSDAYVRLVPRLYTRLQYVVLVAMTTGLYLRSSVGDAPGNLLFLLTRLS